MTIEEGQAVLGALIAVAGPRGPPLPLVPWLSFSTGEGSSGREKCLSGGREREVP
jgi:hypothetical protein